MRVLFYNHTTNISGAERVLLLALRRIDRTVIEPVVICPDGELARECDQLGVPIRAINELNARFTLRPDKLAIYLLSLLKTVRALRNEIISAEVDAKPVELPFRLPTSSVKHGHAPLGAGVSEMQGDSGF